MSRNLVIALCSFLAALCCVLIAEVWVRANLKTLPQFVYPRELTLPHEIVQYDPDLGRHFVPNAAKFFTSPAEEFKVNYQINEIGLRDSGMTAVGKKRPFVLMLGADVVEGWGVMPEATFILELQRQLIFEDPNTRHPRLLNAGMSGYGAAQSVLLGKKLVEQYDVEVIVFVYSGLMPVADHRFSQAGDVADDSPQLASNAYAIENIRKASGVKRLFVYHIAKEFLKAIKARSAFAPSDPKIDLFAAARLPDEQTYQFHAQSLQHIRELVSIAKNQQIKFILLHLPLPHQVAADEWRDGRIGYQFEPEIYEPPELQLIRDFCDNEDIECKMAMPVLRKLATERTSDVYFRHSYGLTEVGHRALVNFLREDIKRALNKPTPVSH